MEESAGQPHNPPPARTSDEHDAVAAPEDLAEELSSSTLAALQEFLAEKEKAASGSTSEEDLFAENWGMSQFWYTSETAEIVANEVEELSRKSGGARIACIACPSLFRQLKKSHPQADAQLLEYDMRFAAFGDQFSFYDYNSPVDLPPHLAHAFGVVIADPPYLSKECLEKTAETMRHLAAAHAKKHLQMRPCSFRPQHTHKLGNEFKLFTNYDPGDRLGGWEDESEAGNFLARESD
eukprot:jgi/Mesen1/2226/ME000152S01316